MVTLFMLKGLPASGKSTWAREYQSKLGKGKVTRVNKDDLRQMLDGGEWSKENEKMVLEIRDLTIQCALRRGRHVICDDTNLDPKHESALRGIADDACARFEVISFTHVSVEECAKRDGERCGKARVGEKVIREMYDRYLKPKPPTIKYNPELPDCILVDVDGTITLRGERDPFDWSRVGEDKPNQAVVDLVQDLIWDSDDTFIFASGRDEVWRADTEAWISKHLAHAGDHPILFMRPQGDMRDDRLVKREIYDREILGKYNVRFVLDDRQKVVDMWRSLGLCCLQVAEGNF